MHRAALLASQVLPTVPRGDTYKAVEWVLLEAHSQLLTLLLTSQKDIGKALIAQRCQRLTALIKRSTIPQNQALLDLQVEVSVCFSQGHVRVSSSGQIKNIIGDSDLIIVCII